jgi:hypothetical protein
MLILLIRFLEQIGLLHFLRIPHFIILPVEGVYMVYRLVGIAEVDDIRKVLPAISP